MFRVIDGFFGIEPMDPETECGIPSTGQKAKLLIGTAR